MGILIPAALALLALAIPIIIFYMLRLRREELDVSSSLLWRRALQDRTANAPWQRLRRNLLLLLQLLLLLLLVLGLARPFLYRETLASASAKQLGDATVVLISDGSLARAGQTAGLLPQMPARTSYVNVGKSSRNLAIISLSLRDAPGGPQLFAGLFNSGPTQVRALL